MEDLELKGGIISEWIFEEEGGSMWIGSIWHKIRKVVGSCEKGHKPSVCTKAQEFFDLLSVLLMFIKDSGALCWFIISNKPHTTLVRYKDLLASAD